MVRYPMCDGWLVSGGGVSSGLERFTCVRISFNRDHVIMQANKVGNNFVRD